MIIQLVRREDGTVATRMQIVDERGTGGMGWWFNQRSIPGVVVAGMGSDWSIIRGCSSREAVSE